MIGHLQYLEPLVASAIRDLGHHRATWDLCWLSWSPPLRGIFVGSVGRFRSGDMVTSIMGPLDRLCYVEPWLSQLVVSNTWDLCRLSWSSLLWELDCFRYAGPMPQLVPSTNTWNLWSPSLCQTWPPLLRATFVALVSRLHSLSL